MSLDQQDKQWMLEQLKATQQHMADLIGGVKESLEHEMRQLESMVDQSATRVERASNATHR